MAYTQLDRIEGEIRSHTRKLNLLCEVVTGDGNPGKGLIVRVDRLEQKSKRIDWIQRVVVTTIIASIVTAVITASLAL